MSIVCSNYNGWLISHFQYISQIYKDMPDGSTIKFKENLFKINTSYIKKCRKKQKSIQRLSKIEGMPQKEINNVRDLYKSLYNDFKNHFNAECLCNNKDALDLSNSIYEETEKCSIRNADGSNIGQNVIKTINNSTFIFPRNCKFYCRDVADLKSYMLHEKFDLILLDPPWWNKYIRRKRKKSTHAYNMMYNCALKEINLKKLLNENGLIAVWCTNSLQHFSSLQNDIFPKWGVNFISKWYWLKVTNSGEPVCDFSTPPGKQPFEKIIFGAPQKRKYENPPNEKVVLSVPSALHSHKPPLVELLQSYLPNEPKCLEIFARYLLPNWTSYGNEVLKFQHASLYDISIESM